MSLKHLLMVIYVSLSTIASQVILKKGLVKIQIDVTGLNSLIQYVIKSLTSPLVLLSLGIQAVGFVFWILVVSKAKLGVAFAVSGSLVYLIFALSSWLFLGEKLNIMQWAGLVLITAGVILMTIPGK